MIFFKLSTFLEIPNNKKLFQFISSSITCTQHFGIFSTFFCNTANLCRVPHVFSSHIRTRSTVPSLFYFLIKIISRSVSVLACRRLGILLRSEGKTENDVEWWCAGRSPRVERRLQRGKKKKEEKINKQ